MIQNEKELIRREMVRRVNIIYDQLIGQSPEDLERHYKLIGKLDALRSVVNFIDSL